MKNFTKENLKTLTAIAANLPGWRIDTRQEVYDHYAVIIGPGNAKLMIRPDKNRWHISGAWPAIKGYHAFTITYLERDHKYTSISVSATRTPKAMAIDIKRRLLPFYLDGLAKVNQYKKDHLAQAREFDLLLSTIKNHLPVKECYQQRYDTQKALYFEDKTLKGDLTVKNSNTADLKLSDITIDQVFKILTMLKQEQQPC